MKKLFSCLTFFAVINCFRAEITVSEFIVSTNPALHVHDNKIGASLIVSGKNITVTDDGPQNTNATEKVVKNDSNNASDTLGEPSLETTTSAPEEELILVLPESESQVPNGLRPDTPYDTGLNYFLVNDFPGIENRPIIYKPHYIQNRPLWSAIFPWPSYAQWRPPFFREDDPDSKQRSNLFPNQPVVGDDVNLSRKELMRMRLNQLRVSKMLPDLHPRTPANTSYVVETKPEPSPTIQWEVPRKLFQWPFWPFTYFFSSNADQTTRTEQITPVQLSEPAHQVPVNEPALLNEGQRNLGNQFQIFMEFGRNWNPGLQQ